MPIAPVFPEAGVDSLPKAPSNPKENRQSLANTLPGSRWTTVRSVLFGMLNAKKTMALDVRAGSQSRGLNAKMPIPLPIGEVINLADAVRD